MRTILLFWLMANVVYEAAMKPKSVHENEMERVS